jgi:Transposase.
MDLADPREGVLVGRRSPYPAEFRNDAVALYRAAGGKRTYAAVAADVGVTGETLRSWQGRLPAARRAELDALGVRW